MKILVTGSKGQLGRALMACCPNGTIGLDLPTINIVDSSSVDRAIKQHAPTVVINAAAYTAVDKAETDKATAFDGNARGPDVLARACRERDIKFLHVSTDYVFDGAATQPYGVYAKRNPVNVYGTSKAAGEDAVWAQRGTVVRTSWLFSEEGPSFVHTISRLAHEQRVLRIVGDQIGRPTYAGDLAGALLQLAHHDDLGSTYHYANSTIVSWYSFAEAVINTARKLGAQLQVEKLGRLQTADYPVPARRPGNSVLDTTRIEMLGITCPPWDVGLAKTMQWILDQRKS